MSKTEQLIIDAFHRLYYEGPAGADKRFMQTYWLGVPCMKCPLDLWIYQEIMAELKPDLIIETGTYKGGSALYLAGICDALGTGKVVSIDIDSDSYPQHPRIAYLHGSSVDPAIIEQVQKTAHGADTVLVILDSDHSAEHVAKELAAYSALVSPGSYIIVEDTNVNGHPVFAQFGDGPFEAVQQFLAGNAEFEPDLGREKFLVSFNPRGFLRRRGGGAPAVSAPHAAGDHAASTEVPERDLDALLLQHRASQLTDQRSGGSQHETDHRIRELDRVLHDAIQVLHSRDKQIDALQAQITTISAGFSQTVEQLRLAHDANVRFVAALEKLAARYMALSADHDAIAGLSAQFAEYRCEREESTAAARNAVQDEAGVDEELTRDSSESPDLE